jgi:ArsR family transcriptional regulator
VQEPELVTDQDRFDEVVFVPLETATRPQQVLAGIARAVGAELAGAGSPLEALAETFGGVDVSDEAFAAMTAHVSDALAPFVARIVAVDASTAMLQAAKKRLARFGHIDLRRGELESLPIDHARLDLATLMLVLHHVPEPERAVAEVARVVKPGGRVVIADMLPHDRDSYRHQMGHIWLGFSEDHIRRMLGESGFDAIRIVSVPPDAKAKGPGLFVATARRV